MDQRLNNFLLHLGLTKNQIKVYLTLLSMGESKIVELAHKTGIHRVAMYALVDGLVKKGYLTEVFSNRGNKISANHPRQIAAIIAEQKRGVRKLELKYEELLPELVALEQASGSKPRVKYFEGVDGLRQINLDIIKTLAELPQNLRITYSYSNPNLLHELFEDYIYENEGYLDLRKKHQIRNRVIALDGEITRDIQKRNKQELREMIILNNKAFPFKNDITIYANKIALESIESESIGVIIESKALVEDQLAIFNLAWHSALRSNKDKK